MAQSTKSAQGIFLGLADGHQVPCDRPGKWHSYLPLSQQREIETSHLVCKSDLQMNQGSPCGIIPHSYQTYYALSFQTNL